MSDTTTHKTTDESLEISELGRKAHVKEDNSPEAHLYHLLNIGWDKNAILIRKYVRKYNLFKELDSYGL